MKNTSVCTLLLAVALALPMGASATNFSGSIEGDLPVDNISAAPAVNPFAASSNLSAELLKSPVISAKDLTAIKNLDLSALLNNGVDRDDASPVLLADPVDQPAAMPGEEPVAAPADQPVAQQQEPAAAQDPAQLNLSEEQLAAIKAVLNNNAAEVEAVQQAAGEPSVMGDEDMAVESGDNTISTEEAKAVSGVSDEMMDDSADSFDKKVEAAKKTSADEVSFMMLVAIFFAGAVVAGGTVWFLKRDRA